MSSAPVIQFDYEMSPYGQKTKYVLTAAGIEFTRLDQPPLIPRPDLEALGITYRRIPLLAVGRDVYADSSAMIDVVLEKLGGKEKVATSKADKAYEAWGNITFQSILPLLPAQAMSPAFTQDRKTIFPAIMREDFGSLAPSALGEFKSRMAYLEDVYLADRESSSALTMADIHVIWPVKWVLNDLGGAQRFSGVDKAAFPKVWALIESLPKLVCKTIDRDEALKTVKNAELSSKSLSVPKDDPLGIAAGTPVSVESGDAKPGAHPQAGKLVGASKHEIVLALDSGVQLHFPRAGYIVRESGAAKL